jgi:hypothetical protein
MPDPQPQAPPTNPTPEPAPGRRGHAWPTSLAPALAPGGISACHGVHRPPVPRGGRPPGQATTGTCHEHDQGKQRLRAHAPGSGRASIVPAFRHRHRVARPGQACRRGPLAKGSRVVVVGRIQQRNWTAEDGSARSVVEVVAEELGRACGGRRRPRPGRRGTPARACVTARAGTSTPFQAHRRRSRPVPAWCCSRPQSEAYSRPTLGTNAGPVMRQVRRGGS